MTLREWCAQSQHGAMKQLAKKAGISRNKLSAIVNGHETPRTELALRLYVALKGAVPLWSILDPASRMPWPMVVRLFDADGPPGDELQHARMAELQRADSQAHGMRDLVELHGLSAPLARRVLADACEAGRDPLTQYQQGHYTG